MCIKKFSYARCPFTDQKPVVSSFTYFLIFVTSPPFFVRKGAEQEAFESGNLGFLFFPLYFCLNV